MNRKLCMVKRARPPKGENLFNRLKKGTLQLRKNLNNRKLTMFKGLNKNKNKMNKKYMQTRFKILKKQDRKNNK